MKKINNCKNYGVLFEDELLLDDEIMLPELEEDITLEFEEELLSSEIEDEFMTEKEAFLISPAEEMKFEESIELIEPESDFLLEEELSIPDVKAVSDLNIFIDLLKQNPNLKITLSF